FPAQPEWNPSIVSIVAEGPLQAGTRITFVGPRNDKGATMRFRPTVLAAAPARELRWLGRLGLPRVFDGEHVFHLEPLPDGGTRFVQEEHFRGVLVPFLRRMLERDTRAGFVAMNDALAARAEERARTAAA
ncbi:MAG TPA: SRPBCC domain-containing protein, partial [Acidimicrobiia bacterium]|nr:SRPBCC domain-containing protein [Acidimicrobiia bacterium]